MQRNHPGARLWDSPYPEFRMEKLPLGPGCLPRSGAQSRWIAENYLWDNVGQVMAHVNVKDAEKELRAQIQRARKFGVPLSHLDTAHGGGESVVPIYFKCM